MAYWFIFNCLDSSIANSCKKTFAKFKYSAEIAIFLATDKTIWVSRAGCIFILELRLKKAMWTMKASTFLSSIVLAYFFLLMILTWQVVGRISAII